MTNTTRFELSEADLPRFWYNINADLPLPPPRCCTQEQWSQSHQISFRCYSRWD